MKTSYAKTLSAAVIVSAALLALAGCETGGSGSSSTSVHGSFHYGVGYSSGFYGRPMYGPGYYPPPIIIPPPRPPRPPAGGGGRPSNLPSMPPRGTRR